MAMFISPKNQILSLKMTLIIISSGVLSMAILMKLTLFPSFTENFAAINEGPFSLYNLFSLLIKPPYLYLLVNCIIISIVASSKLHKHQNLTAAAVPTVVDDVYSSVVVETQKGYNVYGYEHEIDHQERVVKVVSEEQHRDRTMENVADDDEQMEVMIMDGGDHDGILKGVVRIDSMELSLMDENLEALKQKVREKERPLPSARFHHHRKPLKVPCHDGVNGKALRVSKSKKNDTLESTWKTITDGRSIPLTRHLKKSDTWDSHVRSSNVQTTPPKHMTKSETFNASTDRGPVMTGTATGLRREPSVKLKKDPSLGQEELNKRVEAFINKFNEEMKLQRQQSLMQYQEMLTRGAAR